MTGDAITGERQYRAVWTYKPTERNPEPRTMRCDWPTLEEAQMQVAGQGQFYAEMHVEVAEWRRLDSPEPSDRDEITGDFHASVYEIYGAAHGCSPEAVSDHDSGLAEMAAAIDRWSGSRREPSDAERVEAAHQRMHEAQGTVCSRDQKLPATAFAPSFTCTALDLAYVALGVPDAAAASDERP